MPSKRRSTLNPYVKHWIDFCRSSKRGLIGFRGISAQSLSDEEYEELEELVEEQSLTMALRIVFFGTSSFAARTLEKLLENLTRS